MRSLILLSLLSICLPACRDDDDSPALPSGPILVGTVVCPTSSPSPTTSPVISPSPTPTPCEKDHHRTKKNDDDSCEED